jgi:hypothetical protein
VCGYAAAAELQLERELSDLPTVQALRAQAQRSATARLAQLTGGSHRHGGSATSGDGHGSGGGTPEMIQRLRDAAERGSPLLDDEQAASPRSPGAAWGSAPDGHGGSGRVYGGDDDHSSDSGRATLAPSRVARESSLSLAFSYAEPGGALSVHERQVSHPS